MLHNIKMKCALRESYNVLKLKKGDLVMIKKLVNEEQVNIYTRIKNDWEIIPKR